MMPVVERSVGLIPAHRNGAQANPRPPELTAESSGMDFVKASATTIHPATVVAPSAANEAAEQTKLQANQDQGT